MDYETVLVMSSFYIMVAIGLWMIQLQGSKVTNRPLEWSAVVFTLLWFLSIPLALIARRYYGKTK